MDISFSCHKMLLSTLEEHLVKIEIHCADLGLPYSEFEKLSEIWIRRILRKTLDFEKDIGSYKDKVKTEIQENIEKVNIICGELNLDATPYLPSKQSNSYDVWQFLKEQVVALGEKKKTIELEEFTKLKNYFLSLIDVLKKKDLDQSERYITEFTSKSHGDFPIELVKTSIKKLEELKELNKERSSKLLTSIKNVLSVLRISIETDSLIDIADRNDSILCQIDTVVELQKKLDHYLAIRKSQMKTCFENVRKEIKCLWETCNLSEEYKISCEAILSGKSENEEELCELEEYLFKMQMIASKLVSIDEKIKTHLNQFQELEEVEERSNDPDKFLNRGGRMLKDEALKKKLLHSLPKAEAEIIKEIELLKETVDLSLRRDLMSFADECDKRWKQYHNKKSLEIQTRHKNKIDTLNQDLRYGSKPAPVSKRHVAGHASKTTDDIKKKVVPLKPQNPSNLRGNIPVMYAIDRRCPDESTYSTASCFANAKNLTEEAISSTPKDHPAKRFKPSEE